MFNKKKHSGIEGTYLGICKEQSNVEKIKIVNRNFYRDKIKNAENKFKETCKIVNYRQRKIIILRKPICLKIDENIISDEKSVASLFASHFATISSDAIKTNIGYNLSLSHTLSDYNNKSFNFCEVSKIELFYRYYLIFLELLLGQQESIC